MSDEVLEVVVEHGVLSFNGRVLERFGFDSQDSMRVHRSQIESIELIRKRMIGSVLQVKVRRSPSFQVSLKGDDAEHAELERFVAEVSSRLGLPR